MQAEPLAAHTTTGIEDQASLPRFWNGLRALGKLAQDPNDTEQALTAALLLNAGSLRKLAEKFEADPEGKEVLAQRPALDTDHVDLDALGALPAGSLGRSYSEFMRARGLTPEVFVAPPEVADERVRYISQRLRQTHDLWHVVTGYDTDVLGEIELQAFQFGQTRTPFSLLVATLGIVRAKQEKWLLARRVWAAFRRGRSARQLAMRVWERRFSAPLAQVRAELGLAA